MVNGSYNCLIKILIIILPSQLGAVEYTDCTSAEG